MYAATSDIERHAHAWQHVNSAGTDRHATPTSIPTQPPQSQSGWFPLEDALVLDSSSSTVLGPSYSQQQQQQQQQQLLLRPPHDIYAAESLLPPPSSDALGDRWMPSEPYVHDPSRLAPPPGRPDHPVAMYSQQQHAPVYSVHELPSASYAWPAQDDGARLSASHSALPDHFDAAYAPDRLPLQPQQHFHPLTGALTSPLMRPPLLYQSHYDSTSSSMSHLTPPAPPLPLRRKAKAITIGRWSADEHKWFLKGLEMFQGPAWGEIARLIGSRTSTQVRTHAQKFFTKLARLNQTLPYFDAQIQRERTRLEALGGSSSVTPTASTSAFSFALSSLSPHKRVSGSPLTERTAGGSIKREPSYGTSTYDDTPELPSSSDGDVYQLPPPPQQQSRMAVYESHETERMRASDSGFYHTQDSSSSSADAYRPKYDADAMSPLLRKPRMYVDSTGYAVASPPVMPALALPASVAVDASSYDMGAQQPHGSVYASLGLTGDRSSSSNSFDSARLMQFPSGESPMGGGYSLLPASSSSDGAGTPADAWSGDDAAQRQWLTAPLDSSSSHQVAAASAALDADSLPSMHKLLFRSGSGA